MALAANRNINAFLYVLFPTLLRALNFSTERQNNSVLFKPWFRSRYRHDYWWLQTDRTSIAYPFSEVDVSVLTQFIALSWQLVDGVLFDWNPYSLGNCHLWDITQPTWGCGCVVTCITSPERNTFQVLHFAPYMLQVCRAVVRWAHFNVELNL